MRNDHVAKLETDLAEMLKKQADFVESRRFQGATDSEILEYELRQEIVKEMCNQLEHPEETL
jgi:hypothetical protein